MTRTESGYVIKINGRKVLGIAFGCTVEDCIKDAQSVAKAGDEIKIYVQMVRDDLDVIDFGDPDHVELKLVCTVNDEADEAIVDTPEAALTLALKLAIQAPTDLRAEECIKVAELIASTMEPKQIEICKMAAEAAVEYEETYQ